MLRHISSLNSAVLLCACACVTERGSILVKGDIFKATLDGDVKLILREIGCSNSLGNFENHKLAAKHIDNNYTKMALWFKVHISNLAMLK